MTIYEEERKYKILILKTFERFKDKADKYIQIIAKFNFKIFILKKQL